jgi:hypothetical protein
MAKTKVYCIQCPNCKDIIYSRARHDFRDCSCGDCAIDGGFDYNRILAKNPTELKRINKFIMGVTRKDLYDDWNNRENKYGVIKEK